MLTTVRPYFENTSSSLHPVVEKAFILKASLENRLLDGVSAGLGFVKDKVTKT